MIRVQIQSDDGSAAHFPSGTVLASSDINPVSYTSTVSFSPTAALVAGTLYHAVFSNIDPTPDANFSSVNAWAQYYSPNPPPVPAQPLMSDSDWAVCYKNNTQGWTQRVAFSPILQLNFADSVVTGIGYRTAYVRDIAAISGSGSAREHFTYHGADQPLASVSIRLSRVSGSDPLTVRLEQDNGTLVEQGSIPADSVPSTLAYNMDFSANWPEPGWVAYTFVAPPTLTAGQAYNLTLTTPSSSVYNIFALEKGSAMGFSSLIDFPDGNAQYTTDSEWTGWGGTNSVGDLQFYFLYSGT